ncbi:MAG: DUF2577 domain-containing protein [Eubacteriales bacterium]|nr:DUF2577 domain-containing protein [Eubacteriales bacterium]
MNFSEIIKTAVLQVINNIRFTEVFIGQVIDEENLKIKLDEKIILTENEIVRTGSFTGILNLGARILLLREQGGQRYYLINTIPIPEEENEEG